ncbi:MAG: hypothetical protein HY788_14845 [Deltaproteobacteria bacterium]|nr:hypothetical protein [Deltaproteobacteria bacterium]
MVIKEIHHFDETELIQRLRDVCMHEDRDTYVYRNTFISLEKIQTRHLSPPQYYILRSELDKVRSLKWALQERGFDLFRLDGFLRLTIEGFGEPIDLLPPIVEESIEADGSLHLIVNDGMHRIYLAYLEWQIPQVVFVRGVPKELPYYAFPIPLGWEKLEVREDIPSGYVKKWHRIEQNKMLYRDFNSAFTNVGGPRGHFEKPRST